MTISRSQMGSQLTGNRTMKKRKTKKMALGGLAAVKELGAGAIPTVALARSLKSGQPEGILKAMPIAQAMRRSSDPAPTPSTMPSGPMQRPERAAKGMKRGGRVRGDGIAQRGKTKGRFV